jgi:TPR repeat protein
MKLNRLTWALLLVLAGSTPHLCGQSTAADRKQFDAVKARADKGDTDAQLALASLYARGLGVSRDLGKAAKWHRKAAEAGAARGQCMLGLDYSNGEGVKMDKVEAARWFKRAADQGLAEAQLDLGLCYANGDGVERSDVEAATWYRKAGAQGLSEAQCALGTCYLDGTGVPKDIPEGLKWIQTAAEQGFAPAQTALGRCYTKGKGVPKDYVQAYKWLNLAAAKGGELGDDARVELAMTERFLTPEQVAEGQRLAHEFKPHKASPPGETPASPPAAATATNAASDWASVPAVASKAGFVNVSAADTDCEIFVDGGFVGNTPARVKLAAGTHVVEVKKAGFKDYRRQLQINDGSELTLRAVLEKQ